MLMPKKKKNLSTGNVIAPKIKGGGRCYWQRCYPKKKAKRLKEERRKKKYNLKWRYLYKLYHSALFPLYFPPKLRG